MLLARWDERVIFRRESFTSLSTCQDVLKTRKEQKLKYADTNLPDGISEVNGYHLSCYNKSVALSKKQRGIMNTKKNSDGADNTDDSHADNTRTTRPEVVATRTTKGTDVFNPVCLLCGQQRKRVQNESHPVVNVETQIFEINIRKYVEWMEDNRLASMISEGDFIAKEVRHHGCCRVKY